MRRVAITGMGLVSPLGNNKADTLQSLMETRSGIKFQQTYADMGLRSHVAGSIDIDVESLIDRKLRRFMGDAAAFAYISLVEAIADSGLAELAETRQVLANLGIGQLEGVAELPRRHCSLIITTQILQTT